MQAKVISFALLLLLLPLLQLVSCHRTYLEKIPNGQLVLNPCDNSSWIGVGHWSVGGGGPRNQFGIDFKDAEHQWTSQLCRKDSDGDGRSNGEELGDPDCAWRVGGEPARRPTGHPGVCEPTESDLCRERNAGFTCAGSLTAASASASAISFASFILVSVIVKW